jgi:NADH:ubiquinone oxidoreductase subunit D
MTSCAPLVRFGRGRRSAPHVLRTLPHGAAKSSIGIRTGADNHLERCKIKDPSLNNWPALVEAVQGNITADFPVINKSFNLSYSGTDR